MNGYNFRCGMYMEWVFFNFAVYMNEVRSKGSSRTSVPKTMASYPPPCLIALYNSTLVIRKHTKLPYAMYRECDSVVSSQTTPALVVWRIKTEYPVLWRFLLITYYDEQFYGIIRLHTYNTTNAVLYVKRTQAWIKQILHRSTF